MKKISILHSGTIAVFAASMISSALPADAENTRIIRDMDENLITVPADPQRIACMHGVSSDRIIMLDQGRRLILTMKPSPWCAALFPEVLKAGTVAAPFTGNLERLLSMNADLVLFSPNPEEAKKYEEAGLRTACGFSAKKRPRSMEAFQLDFKRQVSFIGDLLGPEAKQRADAYNRYFDLKISNILAVTSKIPVSKRPKVYYGGRSGNLFSTQGKASVLHWFVETAGGNFVPQEIDSNFAEANMEKVWSWDPDIILLSGSGPTPETLKANDAWNTMHAVKNNRIYRIPQGVFMWEQASGESVLLAIYLAKIFHPDLFKDWDLHAEMKYFYTKVYGRNISDNDIRRILECLPPQR